MLKSGPPSMWRPAKLVRIGRHNPAQVWSSAKMKYIEFNRPEEAVLADMELRDSQMSDQHKSVTILVSTWEFSHFWEQKARSSETLIVVKDWRETFIEVDSESL